MSQAGSFYVAFSTSSPVASVAILGMAGEVFWTGQRLAPQAASGACMDLLSEGLAAHSLRLQTANGFLADLGPGSFTGVRVGVMLAKTLAYSNHVLVAGASAFDLLSPNTPTFVPSRKNEYFIRYPGQPPVKATVPAEDGIGYPNAEDPIYPLASGFQLLFGTLAWVAPELLVPLYFAEPSISQPKRAFGSGVSHAP